MSNQSSTTNPSGIVHNTLAGNRLDPRIEADGHMGTGEGVGGTSDRTIQREGIEHIKNETFGTSGTHSSSTGYDNTNTNTHITGSGIGSGVGVGSGVGSGIGSSSTTGYDSTPSHSTYDHSTTGTTGTTSSTGGVVDTVKSYLGLGGASSTSNTTSTSTGAHDPALTSTSHSTTTGDNFSTGNNLNTSTSNTFSNDGTLHDRSNISSSRPSEFVDSTSSRPSEFDNTTSSRTMTDSSVPHGSEHHHHHESESRHSTHPETSIQGNHTGPGHHEHNTLGDKHTTSTTDAGQAGAGPGDVGESNKHIEPASGKPRHLENPSAIPTAGGERLGEKHWGESKVVPDLPPKEGEVVSSRDGQPTGQVRDNTAANTGSATAGPHGHGHGSSTTTDHAEKEGLADKVKHSLHMGGK